MISSFSRKIQCFKTYTLVIGGGLGCYRAINEATKYGKTVFLENENISANNYYEIEYLSAVSRKYYQTSNELIKLGIHLNSKPKIDLRQIQAKKRFLMISKLMNLTKTKHEKGDFYIKDFNNVIVKRKNNEEVLYNTKRIIFVNGNHDILPSEYQIDEKLIHSSSSILKLTKVPKHLIIIGGGSTGLEVGTIWKSFGAKVSICDISKHIGGKEIDKESSKTLMTSMKKKGFNFYLGENPILNKKDDSIEVKIGDKVIQGDHILISIGHKPNTNIFNDLKIKMNNNYLINVNKRYETNIPNIYALGDIIGSKSPQETEIQAKECILMINGKNIKFDHSLIPIIIRTNPGFAKVGINEEDARLQGIKYKVGRSYYRANSRARTILETDGFVKWICSPEGIVLGMTVVGPNVQDAIKEGIISIQRGLNISDVARVIRPHPTLSEIITDSSKSVLGTGIHS